MILIFLIFCLAYRKRHKARQKSHNNDLIEQSLPFFTIKKDNLDELEIPKMEHIVTEAEKEAKKKKRKEKNEIVQKLCQAEIVTKLFGMGLSEKTALKAKEIHNINLELDNLIRNAQRELMRKRSSQNNERLSKEKN